MGFLGGGGIELDPNLISFLVRKMKLICGLEDVDGVQLALQIQGRCGKIDDRSVAAVINDGS